MRHILIATALTLTVASSATAEIVTWQLDGHVTFADEVFTDVASGTAVTFKFDVDTEAEKFDLIDWSYYPSGFSSYAVTVGDHEFTRTGGDSGMYVRDGSTDDGLHIELDSQRTRATGDYWGDVGFEYLYFVLAFGDGLGIQNGVLPGSLDYALDSPFQMYFLAPTGEDYQRMYGSFTRLHSVPEPATLMLMSLGVGVAAVGYRRRRGPSAAVNPTGLSHQPTSLTSTEISDQRPATSDSRLATGD